MVTGDSPLTVDVGCCCVLVESVLNDVDVWSKCEILMNETVENVFLLDCMCLFTDSMVRRKNKLRLRIFRLFFR